MTKTWIDARDLEKKHITTALEKGVDTIWVDPERIRETNQLGEVKTASEENGDIRVFGVGGEGDGTKPLPKQPNQSKDLEEIKKHSGEAAEHVVIRDKQHEEFAKMVAEEADYLLIRSEDWKIIPLENLIADLQEKDVEIIAGIDSPSEAKTALTTLEEGADGVLFKPASVSEIDELSEELMEIGSSQVDLKEVEIKDVREVGMGDRVCVDTSTMMKRGEGMLVGSSSSALFLVHSESIESEYADPRPFRVNAGGVHSYVLVPGGDTKYLSELSAGDSVLVVDTEGGTKEAVVGRAKIERRPMMLVTAAYEEAEFKVILQNAETIRLVDREGEPVSIAELERGDRVLARIEEGGRHFGEKIEETIIEK